VIAAVLDAKLGQLPAPVPVIEDPQERVVCVHGSNTGVDGAVGDESVGDPVKVVPTSACRKPGSVVTADGELAIVIAADIAPRPGGSRTVLQSLGGMNRLARVSLR